jgi:regulatory protein
MNEVYGYALKLLQRRDYTVQELEAKLAERFGTVPEAVIEQLTHKKFLNDRRFTENYVAKRRVKGRVALREEIIARGVAKDLVDEILGRADWPSLRDAMAVRMNSWKLRAPLQSHDAARLFRALLRLGYDEDAIREEIEQLRER